MRAWVRKVDGVWTATIGSDPLDPDAIYLEATTWRLIMVRVRIWLSQLAGHVARMRLRKLSRRPQAEPAGVTPYTPFGAILPIPETTSAPLWNPLHPLRAPVRSSSP